MKEIVLPKSYNYISAFLTFRCNFSCGFCVNNASNKDFRRNSFKEISGKEWVNTLNKIKAPKEVPYSLVGGEPSLHKDFIYILKNLKSEQGIDLVTNLWWSEDKIKNFIEEIPPDRINNYALFPSIRVSYHPGQIRNRSKLLGNVLKLKNAGFDIGVEGIMYPSPFQLESLENIAMECKKEGISFRPKSFIGVYEGVDDKRTPFSITHGDYKYSGSVLGKKTYSCLCKTSNLLINPEGKVYRCQRDLLLTENSIGNLLDEDYEISEKFLPCKNYGQCHPCDVKVKTNNKQEMGTTLVEIKDVKEK